LKNEEGFSFNNVMKIGEIIFNCQLQMSKSRVERNSMIYDIKNNNDEKVKVAITCANELVELCHDALKEKYKDIKTTITTNIAFENNKTLITYSVRTIDEKLNLKDLFENLPNKDFDKGLEGKRGGGGRKE